MPFPGVWVDMGAVQVQGTGVGMIYEWIRDWIPVNTRHAILHAITRFRVTRGNFNISRRIALRKICQLNPLRTLPQKEPDRINLHLGCGSIDDPRFINIDGMPHGHVDLVHTLATLPQFADSSVDLVYASHCLEHFRYRECEKVLTEWFRVLKSGGTLRVSVPDFDLLLKIYSENGSDPDLMIEQLLGGQDNRYNFHFNVFNRVNLVRMLRKVGFTTVRDWTYKQDAYAVMEDFSIYRKQVNGEWYEVSLNLDAIK